MKLRDFLQVHSRLITIDADDSIDKALVLMQEHGIRHLPVVRDGGVLIGMLSDRDLLEAVGGMPANERHVPDPDGPIVGPRRVREVMSIPALALGPDEPFERAARLMLEKRFNAVPVSAGGRVLGIVTETDLLRCFLNAAGEPRGAWRLQKVGAHLHARVFALGPDDLLGAAARLMREKHIRHVPILVGGVLVGIVSDRDVRRWIGLERLERAGAPGGVRAAETRIADVMTGRVETITPDATLAQAAERMIDRKIGALPVLDEDDALIGILTETDLLRAFVAACLT